MTHTEWIVKAALTLKQFKEQHSPSCVCMPCINTRWLSENLPKEKVDTRKQPPKEWLSKSMMQRTEEQTSNIQDESKKQ